MRKKPLTEQEIEKANAAYWEARREASSLEWEAKKHEESLVDLLRYRQGRSWYGTFARGSIGRAVAKAEKAEGVVSRLDRRRRCGAKTRKGTPCQCKPEEGRDRCKLHGGKSTGPRSEEGREAVRESNRRRAEARRSSEARRDLKSTVPNGTVETPARGLGIRCAPALL